MRIRIRLTTSNRREWASAGLVSLGLVLALLAQYVLWNYQDVWRGAILYGAAWVLLGAWLLGAADAAIPTRAAEGAKPRVLPRLRRWLVVPAVLLAEISFVTLEPNTFTPVGTLTWLGALALFMLAVWDGAPVSSLRGAAQSVRNLFDRNTLPLNIPWVAIALAGILMLGAYFYFYRLDAIPAEMTSDHSEKILDTFDILQGDYSIFFERNTGREPLQFYLNAAVVALGIAPLGYLALKIVTALAGFLIIPGVFFLARELFDDQIGLLAAFFTAVSIWSVAIARVGLRFPLAPVFVAWAMFFLVRGLRTQTRNSFLLAGLMLGIGLNGYSPFRVVPLVTLAFLGIWFLWGKNITRGDRWHFVANAALMFVVMLLVCLPLLRYTIARPEMVVYRMGTRLTEMEEPIQGNPALIFVDNVQRALLMFNVHGDMVWVNTLSNYPVVDFVTGALILVGAVYAAYRLIRFREIVYLLLFAAIFILLLPSTLSMAFPRENPSVVRTGGAIPFVFMLAALPLALWYRQWRAVGSRWLGVTVLGLLLMGTVALNSNLYFTRYDQQYRDMSWNATEIAGVLREFGTTLGDPEHAFLISFPHWVDHRAVGIEMGDVDWDNRVMELNALREHKRDPALKLYLVNQDDRKALALLRELYPDGIERLYPAREPSRDFVMFYAPAQTPGQ